MITLLLLPGMDGTGTLFEPLVAALGDSVHAVIVRYPVDQPLGYAGLIDLAQESIPASGEFVILGESFSGPVAIALAARQPERLRGLILCATFVRSPIPGLSILGPLLNWLPMGVVPVRLLGWLLLGRWATPERVQALSRGVNSVTPAVLRCRLRALLSVDVASELRSVKIPVLVLRATHDRLIPRAAARAIADCCSAHRDIELSAPHLLLQSIPTEAARVITEFVARL